MSTLNEDNLSTSDMPLLFRGSTLTGLLMVQVNSPYPLSVVRSSRGLSPTRASYHVSILPDYHCPPEPSFTNLNVTLSSPLTRQEEVVSVTFLESDISCPTDTPNTGILDTPKQPSRDRRGSGGIPQGYFPYILVAILAVVLVTIVVCLALGKTNSHPNTGFSAHLPRGSPLSPAHPLSPTPGPPHSGRVSSYSQHQQTPSGFNIPQSQQATPISSPATIVPGSTGPYKRPGFSPSPVQHGLFSQ